LRKQYKLRSNYNSLDSFIITGQFEVFATKEEEDDDENDENNEEKDGDKGSDRVVIRRDPLIRNLLPGNPSSGIVGNGR